MFENNPFTTHTIEIFIMLLGAAFIGLWLGWVLWGRLKQDLERLRVDNQSLNVTIDAIRLEMESLRTRAVVAESDNSNYVTEIANLNHDYAALKEKASYLENALAEVRIRNRQVETELGLSYSAETAIADDIPLEIKAAISEPMVSYDSTEVELNVLPEEVTPAADSIVESEIFTSPVLTFEPIAVVEPKPETPGRQKSSPVLEGTPAPAINSDRDDLTVIEGIGPKIQMLLNQFGIYTYRQLSESDVTKLREVLAAAGPQLAMHDPGTWPSQANLAANDQWDTLKSVQGFLKGGKKPD
jgi:predicted flap endonuclease-1-like 5' DNA nuclease